MESLTTNRLELEPVVEAHMDEIWSLFKDPLLHSFTPFDPVNFEHHLERFMRWTKRQSPDGKEIWLNWLGRNKANKRVIAHYQVGINGEGIATIGYLVARGFHRKGIAFEGISEVLRYLRRVHKPKQFRAYSDTRNLPSHALLKKLGFTQTDFIKDAEHFKGAPSDEYVFTLPCIY